MNLKDIWSQVPKIRFGLILAFIFLVIPHLGNRPLWQDEAETALVARQMVNSNVWLPYAYDEQGPISQDWNYQFSVSPLWRWHPWLQFYITAISFKLLGVSAFSARLPFALLGIISYWYFLSFLTRHSPFQSLPARQSLALQPPAGGRAPTESGRGNPVFFLTAAVLFLLSTPLLLHFRQSRYYSLSLLFTLIAIDGYLDMKRRLLAVRPGVSSKYSMKYILGSVLLFHSFLPAALALQISFWIDMLRTVLSRLKRSDLGIRQGQTLIKFTIAFALTLLFTLPWAVWLKIGGQNLNFSPELIKQHLIQHYLYIHKFIFPALTLIPLISPDLRKKFFGDDKLVLFSIFISISVFLYTFNHPYFFRYTVPLIPFFIYIAAWLIANSRPLISLIPLIALILMTTKTFPKYLYEITHQYNGANNQLILFLNSLDQNRYKNLAVNYDDFTFRFHTSFIVYGAQHLCGDEGAFFPGNREPVTSKLELETNPGIGRTLSERVFSRPASGLLSRRRASPEKNVPESPLWPSVSKKCRRDSSPESPPESICPDVIIIFPDWGNEEKLRQIAKTCRLAPNPLSLHYAKLADDPDPTNHQFTPPPPRTLEAFLSPPSPN